jgi:acyl-coenzyme A thioesterase PaaI-like protein
MVVSENTLKWVMRFYPPLFFQRIWVIGFHKGFTGVKVKVSKSILNKNYNGSIFGGTIFAAADPFYPVLFHQILNSDGKRRLAVWSKSAKIDFLKPALNNLFFEIKISDEDIAGAKEALIITGKYEKLFPIDIYNKAGEVCASLMSEVYVRDLDLPKTLI